MGIFRTLPSVVHPVSYTQPWQIQVKVTPRLFRVVWTGYGTAGGKVDATDASSLHQFGHFWQGGRKAALSHIHFTTMSPMTLAASSPRSAALERWR